MHSCAFARDTVEQITCPFTTGFGILRKFPEQTRAKRNDFLRFLSAVDQSAGIIDCQDRCKKNWGKNCANVDTHPFVTSEYKDINETLRHTSGHTFIYRSTVFSLHARTNSVACCRMRRASRCWMQLRRAPFVPWALSRFSQSALQPPTKAVVAATAIERERQAEFVGYIGDEKRGFTASARARDGRS